MIRFLVNYLFFWWWQQLAYLLGRYCVIGTFLQRMALRSLVEDNQETDNEHDWYYWRVFDGRNEMVRLITDNEFDSLKVLWRYKHREGEIDYLGVAWVYKFFRIIPLMTWLRGGAFVPAQFELLKILEFVHNTQRSKLAHAGGVHQLRIKEQLYGNVYEDLYLHQRVDTKYVLNLAAGAEWLEISGENVSLTAKGFEKLYELKRDQRQFHATRQLTIMGLIISVSLFVFNIEWNNTSLANHIIVWLFR